MFSILFFLSFRVDFLFPDDVNLTDTVSDKNSDRMIPDPDYNEDDRPNYRRIYNSFNNNINDNMTERLGGVVVDKEGLVVPRKPANPCIESMERRDLHRELMFHQKTWVWSSRHLVCLFSTEKILYLFNYLILPITKNPEIDID